MSNQTFLYWGMIVTMFLVIALVLTAREIIEQHLEERHERASRPPDVANEAD